MGWLKRMAGLERGIIELDKAWGIGGHVGGFWRAARCSGTMPALRMFKIISGNRTPERLAGL